MKNELDNPNDHLEVWDADEKNKLSDSDYIATGQVVKLIVDNVEQDSKIIVVKGDVNGDGYVTLIDAVGVSYHYVGIQNNDTTKRRLVGEYLIAADVNNDDYVTLIDAVGVAYHYVKKNPINYKTAYTRN